MVKEAKIVSPGTENPSHLQFSLNSNSISIFPILSSFLFLSLFPSRLPSFAYHIVATGFGQAELKTENRKLKTERGLVEEVAESGNWGFEKCGHHTGTRTRTRTRVSTRQSRALTIVGKRLAVLKIRDLVVDLAMIIIIIINIID